jgi:chromosome partitioning protein
VVRYITYIKGSRHDDDNTITSLSPEFFAGRDDVLLRAASGAHVLTIGNNKGGVGKTTTAYYVGAELARKGKRVLLVDLDGQANLTECCFPEQVADHSEGIELFPNITQYFSGQSSLKDLITATAKERLSIIASDPNLTLRDLGGSGRPDVEVRFVRDIQKLCMQPVASLGGLPDWIIIDTPPALSVFTRAGLAAAHYVLAPVRPRLRSLPGTRMMLKTLQTMNALTGNGATFMGMVITHWDGLKISQDFERVHLPRELAVFGGQAFVTKIPIDNQLESLEPGAKTGGARAYDALADEVLRYVQAGADSQVPAEVTGHVYTLGRE